MSERIVDKYAERRAAVSRMGSECLDDSEVQRVLSFNKHGRVMYDRLGKPALEFEFPSPIGDALFFQGSYEAELIGFENMLLTREPAPVLLDVGANIGLHALSWCTASPRARVYAFEAEERQRALLIRNVERNKAGERINVIPATGVALDEFALQAQVDHIALIRVDAREDKAAVFEGAAGILDHLKPPIVVSFGTDLGEAESVIVRLQKFGYRANALVDGYAVILEKPHEGVRHYAFLKANHRFALSTYPGSQALLAAALERFAIIRRGELTRATLESRIAEAENDLLLASRRQEEATLAISELTRQAGDLSRTTAERQAHIDALEEELRGFREIAEERQVVIDELADSVRANERAASELSTRAEQQAEVIADLSAQLERLHAIAEERLAVIDSLEAALQQMPP